MEGFHDVLTVTVKVAAAIAANRFITATGAVPAADGNALGVTCSKADAENDLVPVQVLGVALVEAAEAIPVGSAVETNGAGKAEVQDGAGKIVGRALTAAAADGDLFQVHLIPN